MSISLLVQKKVKDQFSLAETTIVFNKFEEIYTSEWNVGKEQLCNSILNLSNGSIEKFLSFFPIYDPRDIVFEAQNKSLD